MKVAFLTSGGIAPCLSSSIGRLIYNYNKIPNVELIGYLYGYKGLLQGKSMNIPLSIANRELDFYSFGGSFLGNSRVKLTNINDCIKNQYIKKGENPLEIAAKQLIKDEVEILHTIGGDDTNTTAAHLVNYLKINNYKLTVVGLPKTIDNDVYPISQTLGAYTAAEHTSNFFKNIVNENTTSSRQLIIHEVMGRNCGWLTAYSAYLYKNYLDQKTFINEIELIKNKWDVHAVYFPELEFNLEEEVDRLNVIMNKFDCVNIFLSEGAGIDNIVKEKNKNGEKILKDAFGHYRLDDINPGEWFGSYFKSKLNCDKILIQKSGYFARSASPNAYDIELIKSHADLAVKCALEKSNGVIGIDEVDNKLKCITFDRVKGGKPFDSKQDWIVDLLQKIGQL